jgi:hypothetical protein
MHAVRHVVPSAAPEAAAVPIACGPVPAARLLHPVRSPLAALLIAALLAAPAAPVRASASDDGSESRIGVMLMVVCGLSLKAAIPAPVPWSGIAVVSCMFGLLDAALSPDESAPASEGKP